MFQTKRQVKGRQSQEMPLGYQGGRTSGHHLYKSQLQININGLIYEIPSKNEA